MSRTDSLYFSLPCDRYTPFSLARKIGATAILESASFARGRERYSILLLEPAFHIVQDEEGVAFLIDGRRLPYKGKNTTFVVAEVVDKDGNLCPWADDEIFFISEGDHEFLGTDNGCQTSMERFTSPQRKAFFGKCLVVVKGKGTLRAQSPMLKSADIHL